MENQSTQKNFVPLSLRHQSPTLVGLGANPDLHGEKPLANRLNHGMVRLEELDVDGRGVIVLFRLTICSGLLRIVTTLRPVCQFVPVRNKEAKMKRNKNETKGI